MARPACCRTGHTVSRTGQPSVWIGAATAERLMKEGASVVIGDRNLEAAQTTAKHLREAGGTALAVEFDLADESSIQALIDTTVTKPENFDANVAIVEELTKFAENQGATLSQPALAWLLAKKDYIVPVPGSRNLDRVAENVAAADLTLTAADLARIAEIAPEGGIGGSRD